PALLVSTPDDATQGDVEESLRQVIHDVLSFPLSKYNLERRIANSLRLREFSAENSRIQQQRERLQNAIDSSDDAVAITNATGEIIYSNTAFLYLYQQL